MTPDDILSYPARILSEDQRRSYFEHGYVAVDGLIPQDWVDRLVATSNHFIERSRAMTASDDEIDLGPGHSADTPRPRRLRAVVDRDPLFWEFASTGPMVEIAADLVGPDIKFHSSKLNYKWPGEAEVVKWHQDILSWPHTNYSPVTLGVYLDDVSAKDGPLALVADSHAGDLFRQYDDADNWTGALQDRDLAAFDLAQADAPTGRAGSVVAINCRTIHGSPANLSDKVRPMLLYVYSSADAFTWSATPSPTSHTGDIVAGNPARTVHMDPRPCPVPPDWDKVGYQSIFASQGGK